MQTALYDASYGRYAGSNISIVSKSGSNSFHGSLFEFFRNDALNANDYFRNRTDQPRGVLKQNQFGFTVGGPVRKDRLLAFGSYQGTRQINGLAAGQARIACSVALSSPPLTDDRSPAALGALFGGMSGVNGGVAVKSDGSNINPVALTLLNFKLPDGTFLIPSPQTVNPAKPFSSQGFSTFSEPCHFNEDQFSTSVDYIISQADRIAARFFFANDKALTTFPGSAVNPTGNTVGSLDTVSPHFRPAVIQQYGLNMQTELGPNWLFELGYVGTRGTDLQRFRSFNQAQSATPDHPVRGEVDNTILNIADRVPIIGFTPNGLILNESAGQSWYNGLEVSLTRRLSRGLQFLASYTFSKTLDTDGANINATSSGNAITRGDQNDANARRGRVSFDRTHRFVFSTTYAWAGVGKGITHLLTTGWMVAGVMTVQSGSAMTVIAVNSTNIFGISQDRAQLTSACSPAQLVTRRSVQSKLNNYFNKTCLTTPPIIGADGIGTDFGNSGTGIVNGPGQANADLSISRTIPIRFSGETNLLFRAEFFNAFNHPQFSNPDNNFSSPTFGIVQLSAVNPRVIQLALDLNF